MGIIDQVGNLILQVQQEKKERYTTCGCASCKLRAEDIETWLNLDKVVEIPDNIYDEVSDKVPCQDQAIAAASTQQVWLCHSCLRKVFASSGHCPYCGMKGSK